MITLANEASAGVASVIIISSAAWKRNLSKALHSLSYLEGSSAAAAAVKIQIVLSCLDLSCFAGHAKFYCSGGSDCAARRGALLHCTVQMKAFLELAETFERCHLSKSNTFNWFPEIYLHRD